RLGQGQEGFLGTSCCPSWVKTARRYYPEYADRIADSYTPMIETAKSIKERNPGARIVFIGPCIAKKAEALEPELHAYVDHVLTFEELASIFVAKEIDLTTIDPKDFPPEASALGRGYAVAGGVGNAISETAKVKFGKEKVEFMRADTLKNCRIMLAEVKAGKTKPDLVEGMACPGGCIGGPGTLIGIASAQSEVRKFAATSPRRLPSDWSQAAQSPEGTQV
ncbi:MAG: hypothetical protein LLF89_01680, partial [Spirochaetaceae bacterium]|nr:hypothetical protein [Spirochaetaceae bacterium]